MASLNLRLGQRTFTPDVDARTRHAFTRHPITRTDAKPTAVVNAQTPARRAPLLALPRRVERIPSTGHGPAVAPNPTAFAIPHRLEVMLFPLTAPASERRRPRRAYLATAAGLPLFLVPLDVAAATAAPPELPPAAQPAVPAPDPDRSAEPTTSPPPATPPAADTTAPIMHGTAVTGPAQPSKVDAAWDGVVGYDVVISMNTGTILKGRVSAVHRDTFTLIDFHGGGVVKVYRKQDVDTLRVAVPEPLPEADGTGLLAGGGILATVGAPVFIAGVVFLGIYPSGTFLNVPLLLTGGAALGGGTAMLVFGARRRKAYRAAERQRLTYAPAVSRTRLGTWTGGLSLRF